MHSRRTGRPAPGGPAITSIDDKDAASAEALHWLIALQDSPDDDELQSAIAAWAARDVRNAAAWQEANRLGSLLDAVHAEISPAMRPLPAAKELAARSPRWKQRLYLASNGVAALAIVAILAWPMLANLLEADYSTPVAQMRVVALEDGSEVTLGADSAIAVDFAAEHRNIRLLHGEAYFEVAPDPTRPFTVTAGDFSATALGTAFDVRRLDEQVSVSVTHGRVAIADDAIPVPGEPLVAGDWLSVAGSGDVETGVMPPEDMAAWRSGKLVVQNTRFADVVAELRRHFAGPILMLDGALADARVTGVYDLANPKSALEAAARVHGGSVQEVTPWILVVSSSGAKS